MRLNADHVRLAVPFMALAALLIGVFALQPRAMSYTGLNLLFNMAVPIALATLAQMFIIAVNDLDLSMGAFVSFVACVTATFLLQTPLLSPISPGGLRRRCDAALRQWDVRYSEVAQPAGSLSGGNAQKVILSREMDDDARLILAAQPTRGLDIGATSFVWESMRKARDRAAKEKQAEENRAKFGRPKSERAKIEAEKLIATRRLEAHRRADDEEDGGNESGPAAS